MALVRSVVRVVEQRSLRSSRHVLRVDAARSPSADAGVGAVDRLLTG